jgi:hypothetical protein
MKRYQTYNELNEASKADKVTDEITKAIDKVDSNLSYSDFAISIAKILKDDYGSHNIGPFMEILHKELKIK